MHKKRATPESRERRKFYGYLFLIALFVSSILIVSTDCLPGLNADSITYLAMADQFLSGNGFSRLSGPTEVKPITIHPPFYAFMLAVVDFIGFKPLNGALFLNAILFFVNVILVGILLEKLFDNILLPTIGTLLFSVSPITVEWHSWAFSEPLYITLSLFCFYYLLKFKDFRKFIYIPIMAVLVGIALVTRYVAFSLFFTIGLHVFFAGKTTNEKIRNISTFGLIGILPVSLWVIRNIRLTGIISGHAFDLHIIPWSKMKLFVRILWDWFIGTDFTYVSLFSLLVFLALMAAAAAYVLLRTESRFHLRTSTVQSTFVSSMVLYIVSFCMLFVVSISLLDYSIPIDVRHFFPIYPYISILVYLVIIYGVPYFLGKQRAMLAVPALITGLLGSYLIRDIHLFSEIAFDERAFGQIIANHDYGYDEIEQLPGDTLIYTNNLELLYILYGRGGYMIPEPWNEIRNWSNNDYSQRIERVRERILEESAVLLYFNPELDEIDPLLVDGMVVYYNFGNEVLYGAP